MKNCELPDEASRKTSLSKRDWTGLIPRNRELREFAIFGLGTFGNFDKIPSHLEDATDQVEKEKWRLSPCRPTEEMQSDHMMKPLQGKPMKSMEQI